MLRLRLIWRAISEIDEPSDDRGGDPGSAKGGKRLRFGTAVAGRAGWNSMILLVDYCNS